MTKYERLYGIAGAVLALGSIALVGAIILDHHERRRAERLIAEMKAIGVAATVTDATEIGQRFRGQKLDFSSQGYDSAHPVPGITPCSDADAVYAITVGPTYKLNRTMASVPGVAHLGLHPWETSATLFVKNQKLVCFAELVRTWQPNGDAVFAQVYMIYSRSLGADDAKAYKVSYARLRSYIYHLEVSVSSQSSADERERAFTIDVRCVTTPAGCNSPGQIMPLSWQGYLQTGATP